MHQWSKKRKKEFKQTICYYYLFINTLLILFSPLTSNYLFDKLFTIINFHSKKKRKKKNHLFHSFLSIFNFSTNPPYIKYLFLPSQTIFILPASYPISKIPKRGKRTSSFVHSPLPPLISFLFSRQHRHVHTGKKKIRKTKISDHLLDKTKRRNSFLPFLSIFFFLPSSLPPCFARGSVQNYERRMARGDK